MSKQLLDGEDLIHAWAPTWRAWPGATILGFVLAPVVVGLVILAVLAIRKRSIRWRVTTRRIEVERGWLSKEILTVELWRVKDVEFRQSLGERVFGVSSIVVTSQDERAPRIELRALPGDRAVYDQLMKGVMEARQQRGVMSVAP